MAASGILGSWPNVPVMIRSAKRGPYKKREAE
jgi:hypothetical protein